MTICRNTGCAGVALEVADESALEQVREHAQSAGDVVGTRETPLGPRETVGGLDQCGEERVERDPALRNVAHRMSPTPVMSGQIQHREQPWRGPAHGGDRVHDAGRGADEACGVVVAVVAHHLDVARVARVAGDDHAVATVTGGLRPLGCELVGEPGDVLEDDLRLPVDDSLHLETHRRGGSRFDDTEAEIDALLGRSPLVHLAQLLDLDAEPGGEHLHRPAPCEREHTWEQQQRFRVERLAEAHRLEEHLGLRVGRVVDDLHHPQRIDVLAVPREREREQIVRPTRVDARREARHARLDARVFQRLAQLRREMRGKTIGTTELDTTFLPDCRMRAMSAIASVGRRSAVAV